MESQSIIQRVSLRWQICILMAIALVLSLVFMGALAFWQSSRLVEDLTLDTMMAETNEAANRIEQVLKATRADTIATPEFPPIPGIIRCWDNVAEPGNDPKQIGSTTELWIDRLGVILREQMRIHEERAFCTVYDDQGQGVMELTRRPRDEAGGKDDEFTLETDNLPPAPGTADSFFERTKALGEARRVHVTSMVKENGTPLVRCCTPFFDKDEQGQPDKFRGVFVIALDGEQILQDAVAAIRSAKIDVDDAPAGAGAAVWTDIVDDTGTYLYSDDPKLRAMPFGTERYEVLKPVRAKRLKQTETIQDTYKSYIPGHERPDGIALIACYRKVFYNGAEDRSHYWAIAPSEEAASALRPVNNLARSFFLFGLIVLGAAAGLITFFASGGLTSSLQKLTRAADQIAGGDLDAPLPQVRPIGEVGTLGSSLSAMTAKLRGTIQDVSAQEARTAAIFNSTADGIVTIDDQGTILASNSAADTMFGYEHEELLGRKVSAVVPALYGEGKKYENHHLPSGQVRMLGDESEVRGTRKDGTQLPVALRVAEMNYSGERLFIATVQDITSRHQAQREREQLFAAVRDAVRRLSSASQQILATTLQQATGAQQQASSVSETVATAEQIAQSAQQAVVTANDVADSARRADEVGGAGRRAVEDAVAAMQQVKGQVESLAENILNLTERAQAIGEITATVNDIAEQTNVLALNAAVEASRAGEHGKGFAVVAAEVKSLAEQSKKATAQVRQILGEIQKATNNAVLSTEQGTEAVSAASQVAAEAGETINSLAGTLAQSARKATQIAAAANQQAAGVGQLNDGIRNIDKVTKQNVEAIRQVEQSAQNLNALSNELASLVAG